jgi:hypothetical protein
MEGSSSISFFKKLFGPIDHSWMAKLVTRTLYDAPMKYSTAPELKE